MAIVLEFLFMIALLYFGFSDFVVYDLLVILCCLSFTRYYCCVLLLHLYLFI